MVLNFGTRGPSAVLKGSRELTGPEGGDFTEFALQVRGKLGGASARDLVVHFRGYTGGIECTDFGQGLVAVAGFSGESPVLFTNQGRLEVVDRSLAVGCGDCIRLLDRKTKRVVSTHPSPSWDLTLSGHSPTRISYDDDRSVYIQEGSRCVQLKPGEPFVLVADARCRTSTHRGDGGHQLEGFPALEPTQWYYEVDSTAYVMLLVHGACT